MQEITALFVAFFLILIAELGDKSQLATISLATKSESLKTTYLGVMAGLTFITLISVWIGNLITLFIPVQLIELIAATIFLVIGAWTLVSIYGTGVDKKDSESLITHSETAPKRSSSRIFLEAFSVICLLELGDKTQITIILLTASLSSLSFVLVGSLSALILVNSIGFGVGSLLSRRLPQERIQILAGSLFIVLGIWLILGY